MASEELQDAAIRNVEGIGPRPLDDLPSSLKVDLPVHGRLDELPGRVERVIPIADERRTPFWVEAPDGPTDPLTLEILEDRLPVDGGIAAASKAASSGWGRGGRRSAWGRRHREPAEFRGDERVLGGGEAEIFLPFWLPRLGPLIRIGVHRIADALGGNRVQAQRREIVGPIESRHQRDSLLVVRPDDGDFFLDDLLPGVPGNRAERRRLVE